METEKAPERGIPQIMKHQDLGKDASGKYLVTEFIFDDESVLTVDFRLQKTHKGSRQMRARYLNDIKALVAYGLPADALDKFIIAREMVERRAASQGRRAEQFHSEAYQEATDEDAAA